MKALVSRIAMWTGLVAVLLIAAAPAAAADSQSMVRVLHASPDAPAVDIYVDDALVSGWSNVPFGTLSDYMAVPAGSYNIKVYATGDTTTAVIDTDVTVAAGMSYTIAASGLLGDSSLKAHVFVDEPNLDASKSLVRVVHLSPDAPAVDVAPDGGQALISNLAFPDATGYAALEPGSYDLEVRVAGTMTVALDLDPITLGAGRAYSVFAIGSAAQPAAGGNALQVVAALDDQLLPSTDTTTDGVALAANPLALAAAIAAGLFITMVLVRARRSAVRA